MFFPFHTILLYTLKMVVRENPSQIILKPLKGSTYEVPGRIYRTCMFRVPQDAVCQTDTSSI